MKKFISYIACAVIAIAPLTAFTATPATAQTYTNRIICQANSPSAIGYGVSYDATAACNRALYECAIRTPESQVCTVTRWFWEVF